MDYQLHFTERYAYKSRQEGITIPAVLKAGDKKVELLVKIDTGASDCLFQRAYAELLGIRVEEGVRRAYSTANSRFEAYGHEISISVLGTETRATVYFFADANIERNVLGRRGWLDRVRVGFVDYEQLVYLADHNR